MSAKGEKKISRITTKGGDKGQTSLYKVGRVRKDHPHIAALGDLDELASWLGLAQAVCERAGYTHESEALHELQEGVASVLNELALSPSRTVTDELRVYPEQLDKVEQLTEEAKTRLPPGARKFVIPGGNVEVAYLHVARTVARRAERSVVAASEDLEEGSLVIPYLNRLSDCCFALALALQESLEPGEPLEPLEPLGT